MPSSSSLTTNVCAPTEPPSQALAARVNFSLGEAHVPAAGLNELQASALSPLPFLSGSIS